MNGVRGHLPLLVLPLVGLGAGIWTFVAPWALGYPGSGAVPWTRSIWSDVIVGAVVAVASAATLVTVLALMTQAGRRAETGSRSSPDAP